MTQKQLSKITGVGRSTISEIERGEHMPRIDVAMRIANALDQDINNVFYFSEGDNCSG